MCQRVRRSFAIPAASNDTETASVNIKMSRYTLPFAKCAQSAKFTGVVRALYATEHSGEKRGRAYITEPNARGHL